MGLQATVEAAAASYVPVGEYLNSVYRPDVDYVDGVLVERNVGEFDHGKIQRALLFAFAAVEQQGAFLAIQEQRVQITASHFRVPDLCLLSNDKLPDRIVYDAPMLCIEVLSPRDSVSEMREKCGEYLAIGVPEVWIVDGQQRTSYVLGADGSFVEAGDRLTVPGARNLSIDLTSIYRVLDSATAR